LESLRNVTSSHQGKGSVCGKVKTKKKFYRGAGGGGDQRDSKKGGERKRMGKGKSDFIVFQAKIKTGRTKVLISMVNKLEGMGNNW